MISTIITLAALGAIGWSAWTIWTGYAAATGTPWERFFAAFRGWTTLLWSHVVMIGGAVLSLLMQMGDLAGMPEIKTLLARYLTPEVAGVLVLVIPAVVIWLRTRTFGWEKPPEG